MSPLPYIISFSIATFLYFVFGLVIFWQDPKRPINLAFFLTSLFLTLTCLTGLTIQLETIYNNPILLRINLAVGPISFCWVIYSFLMFYILITRLIRNRWYVWVLLSLAPVYLSYRMIFIKELAVITTENGFVQFKQLHGIFGQMNSFILAYFVFMIVLLLIWLLRSIEIRKKRQALVLLVSQVITIVLVMTDTYILFYLFEVFEYKTPGATSFYFSIWFVGIAIVIMRYRFMDVVQSIVNKDIIANIEESVVLISQDYKVISMNRKTYDLLRPDRDLEGRSVSEFLVESELLKHELQTLMKEGKSSLSSRMNYSIDGAEVIPMDIKIKTVNDEFDDLLGYLIIANEVKGIKHLKSLYHVTDREVEIIQCIVAGKSNIKIAENLNITERTVKAHLTNIFNKLVIDNRVQLVILLREYNLLPLRQADKITIR